ncbi:MAG: Fe-S cluster assembly ATPase SufC [Clostridiales bacterium]|nr:Fe-S cluster assembly ATPase SufC [Clostridiales bacterium]
MSEQMLIIDNLKVSAGETTILNGLNLSIGMGEVHVIMGPNGAGKSTLANVLMGHPKYNILDGDIKFQGVSINDLKANERAKLGMFLSFQYPEEIPGITVENFLRSSKAAITDKPLKFMEFRKALKEKMNLLEMKDEYATRFLNEGFSGGEKKKSEILQLLMLEPKLAILDETDSGLDVDAVKIVASGVKQYMNSEHSVIIITHHNNILEYLKPDYVHILMDGQICHSGDINLIKKIEKDGYDSFRA